jgi:Biotin-requiring enzyme
MIHCLPSLPRLVWRAVFGGCTQGAGASCQGGWISRVGSQLLAAQSRHASPAPDRDVALPADEVHVIRMPQLAPSMTHGNLVRWLKAEGEAVDCYDLVLEVSTDGLVADDAYKVHTCRCCVFFLAHLQRFPTGFSMHVPLGARLEILRARSSC